MAGLGTGSGLSSILGSSFVDVRAIESILEEAIGHAIGSKGLSIWIDRDVMEYTYIFRLRARRYNREFEARAKVDQGLLNDAIRDGTVVEVIASTAEMLAHEMVKGFARHIQSLGLR